MRQIDSQFPPKGICYGLIQDKNQLSSQSEGLYIPRRARLTNQGRLLNSSQPHSRIILGISRDIPKCILANNHHHHYQSFLLGNEIVNLSHSVQYQSSIREKSEGSLHAKSEDVLVRTTDVGRCQDVMHHPPQKKQLHNHNPRPNGRREYQQCYQGMFMSICSHCAVCGDKTIPSHPQPHPSSLG